MVVENIQKRDGSSQAFEVGKIEKAIYGAMTEVGHGTKADAKVLARLVHARLDQYLINHSNFIWTVEGVQDVVEEVLMSSDFHDVAKAYILYRAKKAESRKRDLFKKRTNVKPYEYPELLEYVDAIRHSYWIHTEFNFDGDIQHFKIDVTDAERNAIKNTMLAIAQIEVAVKTFWGDIYKKMPKPEIGSVGMTFAESEVRHQDAYSHLLEILGLNDDFHQLEKVPAIMARINYLEKMIKHAQSDDNEKYAFTVALFSLFVEHVSLFSQFLIMMGFNKYKNLFKGISNAIEATSKEEQIHGLFGIDIIRILQDERPEWFGEEYRAHVAEMCQEAYDAECQILDWIFEQGELDFLPKKTIQEFIKNRFNNSLVSIGAEALFEIDEAEVQKTDWFDDEVIATKHGDFFDKRAINYNKRSKSVTADDLF